MNNQNYNEDEKAIIALGNVFKIFALIATVLTITFLVYIAFNAKSQQAENQPFVNISNKTCGSFVLYAFSKSSSL